MIKPQKEIHPYQINASVRLRDDEKITLVENLDHTPRVGEELMIDGERWRAVAWTVRSVCERVGE